MQLEPVWQRYVASRWDNLATDSYPGTSEEPQQVSLSFNWLQTSQGSFSCDTARMTETYYDKTIKITSTPSEGSD